MTLSATAEASAAKRVLKLYNVHTGERAQIAYKVNGRYSQAGLRQLNRFLRDFRRNEPTKMDPRLFDVIWEAYRRTGSHKYIHVISGYRSPATNAMLRRTRGGQAKKSQHMLGKAMDFFIPGVPLSKLRAIGFQVGGGGVGYYPRSGSPFVHFDVGRVRAWPRMSRQELVRLFPNGKTLHLPPDGKPLPGYKQALAEYKRRHGQPISIDKTPVTLVASASDSAPNRARNDAKVASAGRNNLGKGLLTALFGGGADEEEDNNLDRASPPKAAPRPEGELPGVTVASATPAEKAAPERPVDDPETIIASLSPRAVPLPAANPRAVVATSADAPIEVALDVPLPTPRPQQYEVASASAEEIPADSESLTGAVAHSDGMLTAVAPLPRPSDDQIAILAAYADDPARSSRSLASETDKGGRLVAAVPRARPRTRNDGKGARVQLASAEPAVTPRTAMLNAPKGQRAAVFGTVKTTPKEARPVASEARPEPRSKIMPIGPDNARWALAVARVPLPSHPPLATESIRRSPATIYTAGFNSAGIRQVDPHRFTGNAVTFLSVAKFKQTN